MTRLILIYLAMRDEGTLIKRASVVKLSVVIISIGFLCLFYLSEHDKNNSVLNLTQWFAIHLTVVIGYFIIYILFRKHCQTIKLRFKEVLVEQDIKQLEND